MPIEKFVRNRVSRDLVDGTQQGDRRRTKVRQRKEVRRQGRKNRTESRGERTRKTRPVTAVDWQPGDLVYLRREPATPLLVTGTRIVVWNSESMPDEMFVQVLRSGNRLVEYNAKQLRTYSE